MGDAGFPSQHTTTTTVTTSTVVQTNLRFDPSYIRTLPGILKCVQILLNLLGFICIEASGFSWHSRGSWFNTVAMTGFWFTGIVLAFYLFHVIEKFFRIPWLKIEFAFCAVWTAFYLIASCLAVTFELRVTSSPVLRFLRDGCLRLRRLPQVQGRAERRARSRRTSDQQVDDVVARLLNLGPSIFANNDRILHSLKNRGPHKTQTPSVHKLPVFTIGLALFRLSFVFIFGLFSLKACNSKM